PSRSRSERSAREPSLFVGQTHHKPALDRIALAPGPNLPRGSLWRIGVTEFDGETPRDRSRPHRPRPARPPELQRPSGWLLEPGDPWSGEARRAHDRGSGP